jgi:hypothetical protein
MRSTGIHRGAKNADVLIARAGGAFGYQFLVWVSSLFKLFSEIARRYWSRKCVQFFFHRFRENILRFDEHVTSYSRNVEHRVKCPILAPDFKQSWKIPTGSNRSSR